MYHYADHKYHAKGSRHAHTDFDKYPGQLDRHLMPGYRERMGYAHANESTTSLSAAKEVNYLTHELEDAEHEQYRHGHDVVVEEHEYIDEDPVDFY